MIRDLDVKGGRVRDIILSLRDVQVHFSTRRGVVKALDGINLNIYNGDIFGLVGETGCGKSVTAFSILNLVPSPGEIVNGEVWFKGEDLLRKSANEIRKIRGAGISMVFQDPMTYLNPVFTIGDQLTAVILLYIGLSGAAIEREIQWMKARLQEESLPQHESWKLKDLISKLEAKKDNPDKLPKSVLKQLATNKVVYTLKLVRMPDAERVMHEYPHELSGGMRQRVMIAMMLSCNPELLIADEATTNLDVTIQAQILELIRDLRDRVGCSFLIITHDFGIVAETCEKIAVMYAGNIVEVAKTRDLFHNPRHPYTEALLKCIPKLSSDVEKLEVIQGNVPDLINPPSGCRFNPRCLLTTDICRKEKPKLIEVESKHFVACHHRTG